MRVKGEPSTAIWSFFPMINVGDSNLDNRSFPYVDPSYAGQSALLHPRAIGSVKRVVSPESLVVYPHLPSLFQCTTYYLLIQYKSMGVVPG